MEYWRTGVLVRHWANQYFMIPALHYFNVFFIPKSEIHNVKAPTLHYQHTPSSALHINQLEVYD
jgi:hypothetical protein